MVDVQEQLRLMHECGYCLLRFASKTEMELHVAHEHPSALKERGVAGYFTALQARYSPRERPRA